MRLINYIFLFCALITFGFGQNLQSAQAGEKEKKIKSEFMNLQIKYVTELNGVKEYELSNGLKVLLKPRHGIPLVTFSIWYKVGSRNETDGIRGIAHFLEHMMFKGTEKYKKGEMLKVIQNLGGIFNAFTSNDETAYHETISPRFLENVIEIEADRMHNLLLNEKELNLERTVVLSELEGNLNYPVTYIDQELRKYAYTSSPYKHPVIGYIDDLKNINSKTMREFYNKYYNPNNSTIVLVGDFNEKNVLGLINKHFGSIKNNRDTILEDSISRDDLQKREKRFKIKRAGTYKLLELGYHITDAKDKWIYPLNILEEILIKGKYSRLNRAIVEKGLATEVSGGAEICKDPGLFYILVSLTPKAKHKEVEKIITDEINKLIKSPPKEDEINAAKNRIKASYLFNLDGTYNQVVNLGFFDAVSDWKQAISWPKDIESINNKDIEEAINLYFQKENRTIGYFDPIISKGEKIEALPIDLNRAQHYQNSNSQLTVSAPLRFNYKKLELKDGSDLLIYKNIDLPITYITGIIKGGNSLLPKEKEWYGELIARTLEKGSKNYTKEEIEKFLDFTGSQIQYSCEDETFRFQIVTLNEHINKTLDLALDILTNPTFPKAEINKEKEKLVAELIESKDSTNEIAKRKFNQIIYPKDHIYYLNDFDEDIKQIKNLKCSELENIHRILVKKNKGIIAIISNLKDSEIKNISDDLSTKLISTKTKDKGVINIPDTLLKEKPKTEITYVKDKLQSDVFLGHAGNLRRNDLDYYKMLIANYIFGGSSLTSRLAEEVRENSGLVYTVYSYIAASHGKGEFGIYFGANNNNVDKAILLIKDELNNFVKNGITEEELKNAKKALIDSFTSRNLSTNLTIANTLNSIEFYDLGESYINDYPRIINSLKLSEINSAIKKYIFPDKLNISIAGEYRKKD